MAWTAPSTWADGDTPAGTDLNAQLRDNLLALSTHAHGGAAGAGDDVLAGVDTITFDDLAASPNAAGELQRNGANLEWYGAAVVAVTQADAAVGTASPRTLGTGAQQAAAGDHTHSLLEPVKDVDTNATGDGTEANTQTYKTVTASGGTHSVSVSPNLAKAGRLVGIFGAVVHQVLGNWTLETIVDGTVVSTFGPGLPTQQEVKLRPGSKAVSSGVRTVTARVTNNHGADQKWGPLSVAYVHITL